MVVIVLLWIVVGVLICFAVSKDSRSDTTMKELGGVVSKSETVNQRKVESIYEMLKRKEKELTEDKSVFLFRGVELTLRIGSDIHSGYSIKGDYILVKPLSCYFPLPLGLGTIYGKPVSENEFIEDFVREAIPTQDSRKLLKNMLSPVIGQDTEYEEVWASIGDGEYFAPCTYVVFRFSDWKIFEGREAYNLIKGKEVRLCENPEKIHWKHFLELEMEAKKEREVRCIEFIDRVLEKQKVYNDLQYKYEMTPSAPISDYQSFLNFCKTVNEDVGFQECEITNHLMLKKLKQQKTQH